MKTITPSTSKKMSIFQHVKYEHMVAGISGGVTSTLILHPLDLIKIRFAGKIYNFNFICRNMEWCFIICDKEEFTVYIFLIALDLFSPKKL